jgi:hypothetical protein
LARVAEDAPGVLDVVELLSCTAGVGVGLAYGEAVGAADLLGAGSSVDVEDLVVALHRLRPSLGGMSLRVG